MRIQYIQRTLTDHERSLLRETGASDIVIEALLAFVEQHRPVGHFLTALLSNDLTEAFARADDVNWPAIGALVKWLYNYAPGSCWGSPEKVRGWLADVLEEACDG